MLDFARDFASEVKTTLTFTRMGSTGTCFEDHEKNLGSINAATYDAAILQEKTIKTSFTRGQVFMSYIFRLGKWKLYHIIGHSFRAHSGTRLEILAYKLISIYLMTFLRKNNFP
jgi:hypothetical protein